NIAFRIGQGRHTLCRPTEHVTAGDQSKVHLGLVILDFPIRSDSTAAMPTTPQFETLLYKTEPPVATITLNRPEALNTIVPPMPDEIERAIGLAERDPAIKVIVLRGAGRAFSGGYDFGGGFQHWGEAMM